MIKNLSVYNEKGIRLQKKNIHKIVFFLKKELTFDIDKLELNFVNSETIRNINIEYLKHNYPTDVISFNYSNENNILDGEIFICFEIAKENAKKYNIRNDLEIKRLIIHGILHLLGYDDTILSKRKKMKLLEDKLVKKTQQLRKVEF